FDNDYTRQVADQRYIEAMASIAENTATASLGNSGYRQKLLGPCAAAPGAGCLNQFVSDFGRRALRRPLNADEVSQMRDLAMTQEDFNDGIVLVLRALLQDPELLYRIEIGAPTDKPNVFRLNKWEMASRLSYLLWGTAPNDALLGVASNDALKTPD